MDALNNGTMENFVFRVNESCACTQFGVKPKWVYNKRNLFQDSSNQTRTVTAVSTIAEKYLHGID